MNEYVFGEAIANLGKDVVGKHLQKKWEIASRQSKNMFIGEGTNTNPNPEKKKWIITILIAAVLVTAAIIAAILLGGGAETPLVENPQEGPETGVYYYDTADGEYILSLNSGDRFAILGPDLNKSGTYAVNEAGITLDFIRDEDGAGSITMDGEVLNLQYKDTVMRFLRKVTYSVSFNANGGSSVDSVDVINGKTVSKPADPKKDGSVFLG